MSKLPYIDASHSRRGPPGDFEIHVRGGCIAVRDASSAYFALVDQIQDLGGREQEIRRLGPASVSWRGAVYTAVVPGPEMGEEANIDLLRRAWGAFDRFDVEAFAACLTEDWREYDVKGNVVSTLEQERQAMELQRSAFTDRHTEIHHILADSDLVACHCTIMATHTGTHDDVEATGTRVVTHVMMFNRVQDGRLAETWALSLGARLHEQITGWSLPGSVQTNTRAEPASTG